MPRPRKPVRLYMRPDTQEWVIRGDGADKRTGHRGRDGRSPAEEALAAHLSTRLNLPATPLPVTAVSVSEVLTYYLNHLRKEIAAPGRQAYAVKALSPFWSKKVCADISEETCRQYAESRPSAATARRELSTLSAALRKSVGKLLEAAPLVWLPEKSKAKPDWLTRSEFAKLLWALWSGPRFVRPDGSLGARSRRSQHAARLALCQFYTGSRPRTVAKSTWARRSDGPWVDLQARIWWRSGDDEPDTKKARRPHSIPPRLLAHLERWKRLRGGTYIVEHPRNPGRPVGDIGNALTGAAARSGVKRITAHTLKHTAITLFIQSGGSAEDASDYFSTSVQTIQSHYWHHSPHHQSRAVARMGRLGR